LDKTQNPTCTVCGSVELDLQLFQVFSVPVCRKCKNEHPERFSLLTKTECKQDYLLTDRKFCYKKGRSTHPKERLNESVFFLVFGFG
jgi:hypothetical protein